MPSTMTNVESIKQFEIVRGVPNSMAAFIRLCHDNGHLMVTRRLSLEAGNCMAGTEGFRRAYFGGAKAVELKKLIPYIRSSHEFWRNVMRVAIKTLKSYGALPEGYDLYDQDFNEPARARKVEFDFYH